MASWLISALDLEGTLETEENNGDDDDGGDFFSCP